MSNNPAPIPPHNHGLCINMDPGECPACDAGRAAAAAWVNEQYAAAKASEYPTATPAGGEAPKAERGGYPSEFTGGRFVPRTDEIPPRYSSTPPHDAIPGTVTMRPGMPQYDLARDVFMADNSECRYPAAEWEITPLDARLYAYNIAKVLLSMGYSKDERRGTYEVAEVVRAWSIPGPVPDFHRFKQRDLLQSWPVLAGALVKLASKVRP